MLSVCLVLQGKQSESDLSEDKESLSQEIEYKKSLVEAQNLGMLDCVFEPTGTVASNSRFRPHTDSRFKFLGGDLLNNRYWFIRRCYAQPGGGPAVIKHAEPLTSLRADANVGARILVEVGVCADKCISN